MPTIVYDGRELPAEAGSSMVADLFALLDSCTTRSRRLVTENDWKEGKSRNALWIRFPQRRAHPTPQKPDLQITEILLPVGSAPRSGEIFVRDGDVLLSPFIAFDHAIYRRIEERLTGR